MTTINTRTLRAIAALKKKLLGKSLTYEDVYSLMDEIVHGDTSDIFASYFVAASFKEGFSDDELYFLTKGIVETGTRLDIGGIVADKHSTGGVAGSRTTMIVVPIVAAAGFSIPKTSTRAITTPAGTADVMELLAPVTFLPHDIVSMVDKVGGCIVWGGHLGIAPADDVIIRVEAPLMFESFDKVIVSIMAKKVAVGTNHLVLDIPIGPTMKIKHQHDVDTVVNKFLMLGERFDMSIFPYVNTMHQPAASGIGPFLEAVDVLKVLEQTDDRSRALEEKSIALAGTVLNGCYGTLHKDVDGMAVARSILTEKKALHKMKEIIETQGGDPDISSGRMISQADRQQYISDRTGMVSSLNNYHINTVARILGAPKDRYAGLYLYKKQGDAVAAGEVLFDMCACDKGKVDEARNYLKSNPIYVVE